MRVVDHFNIIFNMNKEKIIIFYNEFIINNKQYITEKWNRCLVEEYRNSLSKYFGFPQGHRWKYDEWFDIQDEAFDLLFNEGRISIEEKKFYCLRFKF